MKNNHHLLKPDEIQQALTHFVLRREGINPANVEATTSIVFRNVEGKMLASVFVSGVAPHVSEDTPEAPIDED